MSDDKLVKRGELVLLIGEEEDPEEELKRMNRGKVGRPFTYVDSLIWTLVMLRVCLRLPYRQLTGFARRLARILGFRLTIDPSTVYRRIRRLAEGRGLPDVRVEPGRRVVASVDSTGLKVGNYGEWMRHKWKKRRGFVKLHIMVDIETKRILSFEVTDESTSDSRAFPSLLKQAASKAQIEEVLGDGGYDARSCFNGCAKLGAKPLFRVRKNAPNQGEGIPLEGGGREAGEKARPQGVEADGGLRQEVGRRDRHRVLQGHVRRERDGANRGGSPAGGRPEGRGVQPALLNRPRNQGRGRGRTATKRERNNYATKHFFISQLLTLTLPLLHLTNLKIIPERKATSNNTRLEM